MRLYVNLDSRKLRQGLTFDEDVARVDLKRRDTLSVDVIFVRALAPLELDASGPAATGKFMLKETGEFDEDPVVSATSWTKTGTGTSTLYTLLPSLNTEELADFFVTGTIGEEVADQAARYALTGKALGYIVKQLDNSTYWKVIDNAQLGNSAGWASADEDDYVDLMGEIEWTIGSTVTSTLIFAVRVENDVIRGDEGVPTSGVPAYPLPAALLVQHVNSGKALGITGLTGGGSTKLDGIVVTAGMVGRIVEVEDATYPGFWQLQAGTNAESAALGYVRADNYATTTMEFVWVQIF